MKIFIAIDDTDNLESKGTGFRARELAALLQMNHCGQIIGVTRHQLFFNEQIPYTSHNSSACISLESIPGDMFYGCSGVKNMANMFSGSLITSIPAGLFDSCVNVETFAVSFYGTSITSIPAALFDNCNSVSDFSYTFQKCYSLTGDAPELWTRIPEPNGQACFEGDTGLTNYGSIPSGWKTG